VASGNASLVVNDAGTNATPSININSGTLTIGNGVATGGFYVGGKGSGTATVNGGVLNVTANKTVSLGAFLQYGNGNGAGTLNITSGTMQANGAGSFYVGYAQTNTTASGTFAGSGTVNLSGGVLETSRSIVTASSSLATGTGTFNFNGGTLRVGGGNNNLLEVTAANVLNGGAVIDTNTFDATIAQRLLNGGAGGLTKQGGGLLTLSASNSYIGATVVSGGTLRAGNVSAFGSAAVTIASGATLDLNSLAVANAITNNGGTLSNASSYAGTQSLAGSATYGALAGTLSVVSGGAATLGGAVTGTVSLAAGGSATLAAGGSLAQSSLANNGTFTVNRSDNLSLGTVFSGSGGLTKLGSGTLTLTGSSTSSGPTTVSAGKLTVNGVLGSGALSVAAAAWLAGTGTIGGPVVVQGTLGPGNSAGLLAVQSLDLQSTSTTLMEINSIVRGTGYDAVDVSDASGVTYGGGLELSFASLFPDNTSFDLFNFSGSPAGTFATVTASGSYGPLTFVKNAGVWTAQSGSQTISFTESSGNVLVVPEPAAASLGGVAAVSFCVWAVRRRFLADRAIA
jgi:autotransporter-associated beta strand protein